MNGLSILIYLVGIVDPISTFALWLCIPGTIGVAAIIFTWIAIGASEADDAYKAAKRNQAFDPLTYGVSWKWWRKSRNAAVIVALLGWMLYIFVPTRQTLILIAGSEIGGKVIQNEAVHSVVDPGLELVKTWIANETSKLKQETKTNAK